MNIYHVTWFDDDQHFIGAVMIAPDEATAMSYLELDGDSTDVLCCLLGPCTDGTVITRLVCQEKV